MDDTKGDFEELRQLLKLKNKEADTEDKPTGMSMSDFGDQIIAQHKARLNPSSYGPNLGYGDRTAADEALTGQAMNLGAMGTINRVPAGKVLEGILGKVGIGGESAKALKEDVSFPNAGKLTPTEQSVRENMKRISDEWAPMRERPERRAEFQKNQDLAQKGMVQSSTSDPAERSTYPIESDLSYLSRKLNSLQANPDDMFPSVSKYAREETLREKDALIKARRARYLDQINKK